MHRNRGMEHPWEVFYETLLESCEVTALWSWGSGVLRADVWTLSRFSPGRLLLINRAEMGVLVFLSWLFTQVAFKVKLSTVASVEKSPRILANGIYLTACPCEFWLHINFRSHKKTYVITFFFNPENVFLSCM